LLGREGRIPEAAQFSERAIGIQEVLCRKEPNNREYKMELAQFYRTMANVLLYENHIDLAEQRSQQALTLLDELARPASSLGTELAKTRMLRDWLLKSEGQNKR
jgi:hypothetical protein